MKTKIITTLFMIFALAAAANAQRRFDPKATGTEAELRNVAQFAQELVDFIKQARHIEQDNASSEAELKKLQDVGRRVKDASGNFRSNLQGLISKLKSNNRWNDEFDAEFLDSIVSPRLKGFIGRLGGARKALTEAEAAINSVSQDVDATINEARSPRASNLVNEVFFTHASFAPRSGVGGGKVRVKCVLLGVGIAAAEIGKMKLTAENLDNLFDSNKCGNAAASPTE